MDSLTNTNPIFYILMRTDLASMNPGKAVAQGSHAANQMEARIRGINAAMDEQYGLYPAIHAEWARQADGFGTAITLGVTERQLRGAIEYAQKVGLLANVVHDPTYPLRDGDVTHLIPLDTCGWIFGDKAQIQWLLNDLSLMG